MLCGRLPDLSIARFEELLLLTEEVRESGACAKPQGALTWGSEIEVDVRRKFGPAEGLVVIVDVDLALLLLSTGLEHCERS